MGDVPRGADLAARFDEMHIRKGNRPSTMHREADTYHTVMSHAADQGWAPEKYPRQRAVE